MKKSRQAVSIVLLFAAGGMVSYGEDSAREFATELVYKKNKCDAVEYLGQYFIGHYNPRGNFFMPGASKTRW